MKTLWQDLRYGARMLRKNPGYTLAAVCTLALGVGANTALFSVVDAMLIKSLPVKEPARLVLFRCVAPPAFNPGPYAGYDQTDAAGRRSLTSFPLQTFRRVRERPSVLSDVFAYGGLRLSVNADGQADNTNGQAVSGNYYQGLGWGRWRGAPSPTKTIGPGRAPWPCALRGHTFGTDNVRGGRVITNADGTRRLLPPGAQGHRG